MRYGLADSFQYNYILIVDVDRFTYMNTEQRMMCAYAYLLSKIAKNSKFIEVKNNGKLLAQMSQLHIEDRNSTKKA